MAQLKIVYKQRRAYSDKVCTSLVVWYSINREDQENESIFCTKDESLD